MYDYHLLMIVIDKCRVSKLTLLAVDGNWSWAELFAELIDQFLTVNEDIAIKSFQGMHTAN